MNADLHAEKHLNEIREILEAAGVPNERLPAIVRGLVQFAITEHRQRKAMYFAVRDVLGPHSAVLPTLRRRAMTLLKTNLPEITTV